MSIAVHHLFAVALVAPRHQDREFVAADARDAARLLDQLGQDLAGAAQQLVARGMAGLIVGGLQAVDVEDDER